MNYMKPPLLKPKDKVAILAPSSGLATVFPHVYELGIKRLKEVFDLEPIEYPSTRMGMSELVSNPKLRADEINQAFADPDIKAIIPTIGGEDEIKILKYLNADVIIANPKIFLGYSDVTNMHVYLWNLGIVSFYGAAVMTQFGMQGKMHDYTVEYIKKVLFEGNIGEIHPSHEWTDQDLDWSNPENLTKFKQMEPNKGWTWHNVPDKIVTGRLWGGNLEILDFHLRAGHYLPTNEQLEGTILFIETSEELPNASYVYRVLMGMGERGMLEKFSAILVGRAKAQAISTKLDQSKDEFRASQKEAIIKAVNEYTSNTPVIFDLDFGHTDPQLIVPNGGIARIDGINRKIEFSY